MTLLALALVLAAAILHAIWNLFAKRAGGGAAFVWLADTLSVVLYAPVAVIALATMSSPLGLPQFAFMAGSATMHLAYFLLLLRGYRAGDMSLVYPLARGTGPVLATLAAVAFFHETPSGLALAGAGLIAVGVVILTASPRTLRTPGAKLAAFYGLATGATIAIYTLWDKQAVSTFLVPPVLLYYGGTLGRVFLLLPLVWQRQAQAKFEWATHRREVFAVALLSPLSYILVLTALIFTPVSYVAPAREISILIGAGLGTRLLAEGEGRRRLVAACVMVAGVLALALG
jgi:drug/metabolite transporter (DMT)-like permease